MKHLLRLFVILALASPVFAQNIANPQSVSRQQTFTATGSGNAFNTSTMTIAPTRYVMRWWGNGTVSTCTATIQTSADDVTYATMSGTSAQTCTSDGIVRYTTIDVHAHYVRVNLSVLSGGGSITIRLDAYDPLVTSALTLDPVDPTFIRLTDEFIAGSLASLSIGEQGWTMSGTAACGTAVATAGAIPNVGLFTVTTGATSGNTCGLTGAAASALGALGNAAPWNMTWVFKVPSNATAGAYLGFSDSLTAVPSAWAGFKYDTATDATFHLCVNATCDATSPAADTNFHTLKIWSTVAATIWMQLDSAAPVSFCAAGCTNTVTPTTNVVTPIAQAVTRTTAAKTLTVDYFGFRMSGLSR